MFNSFGSPPNTAPNLGGGFGLSGNPQQNTTAFGSIASGGFGQPQTNTSMLGGFGSQQNQQQQGIRNILIGGQTTSGFMPASSMFGSGQQQQVPTTNTASSGLFGSQFGQQQRPLQQQQTNMTGGFGAPLTGQMPQQQQQQAFGSFMQNTSPQQQMQQGGFGSVTSPQQQMQGGFGSVVGNQNQQSQNRFHTLTSPKTSFHFPRLKDGNNTAIHHYITALPEFADMSFEEIHWNDVRNMFPNAANVQWGISEANPTQQNIGLTGGFGQVPKQQQQQQKPSGFGTFSSLSNQPTQMQQGTTSFGQQPASTNSLFSFGQQQSGQQPIGSNTGAFSSLNTSAFGSSNSSFGTTNTAFNQPQQQQQQQQSGSGFLSNQFGNKSNTWGQQPQQQQMQQQPSMFGQSGQTNNMFQQKPLYQFGTGGFGQQQPQQQQQQQPFSGFGQQQQQQNRGFGTATTTTGSLFGGKGFGTTPQQQQTGGGFGSSLGQQPSTLFGGAGGSTLNTGNQQRSLFTNTGSSMAGPSNFSSGTGAAGFGTSGSSLFGGGSNLFGNKQSSPIQFPPLGGATQTNMSMSGNSSIQPGQQFVMVMTPAGPVAVPMAQGASATSGFGMPSLQASVGSTPALLDKVSCPLERKLNTPIVPEWTQFGIVWKYVATVESNPFNLDELSYAREEFKSKDTSLDDSKITIDSKDGTNMKSLPSTTTTTSEKSSVIGKAITLHRSKLAAAPTSLAMAARILRAKPKSISHSHFSYSFSFSPYPANATAAVLGRKVGRSSTVFMEWSKSNLISSLPRFPWKEPTTLRRIDTSKKNNKEKEQHHHQEMFPNLDSSSSSEHSRMAIVPFEDKSEPEHLENGVSLFEYDETSKNWLQMPRFVPLPSGLYDKNSSHSSDLDDTRELAQGIETLPPRNQQQVHSPPKQSSLTVDTEDVIVESSLSRTEKIRTDENDEFYSDEQSYEEDKRESIAWQRRKQTQISLQLPIISRPGYSIRPSRKQLSRLTSLTDVKNFCVKHVHHGSITWPGPVDITGLNLDNIITFERGFVDVYPDEKPPIGEGLNTKCVVILRNCFPINPKTNKAFIPRDSRQLEQFTKFLRKTCASNNAQHLEYDSREGDWSFIKYHWSEDDV